MTIEDRVRRLERQARWWKVTVIGALALLAAGVAADRQPVQFKNVVAEGFYLVDGEGEIVGTWYVNDKGLPTFSLEGKAVDGGKASLDLYPYAGSIKSESAEVLLGVSQKRATMAVIENDKTVWSAKGP